MTQLTSVDPRIYKKNIDPSMRASIPLNSNSQKIDPSMLTYAITDTIISHIDAYGVLNNKELVDLIIYVHVL